MSSMRVFRSVALLLAALWGSSAALACGSSDPKSHLATFRSQPPLLAADPDSALVVVWYRNGCVDVTLPRQDRDRGRHRMQLARTDHTGAKAALDALGLARLDLRALSTRLAQAKATRGDALPAVRVADENILELTLAGDAANAAAKATTLRYASLREDALRFPGDPDIEALLAAESLFLELAMQARRLAAERQR